MQGMRITFTTAVFVLALTGLAFTPGLGTRGEAAANEVSRQSGEVQVAQNLREKGASNRYKEQLRRNLLKGQHGDAAALRQVGFHYSKGWGVIRDLTKAYMWFTLAAQEGNDDALENRNSIARALNDAQIANAKAMAARWLETHEWVIEAGSFGA